MSAPYLIFGGSGGVGSALAARLHRSGANLHLAARDEARLEPLARRLGGAGFSVCDVMDPASVRRTVEEAGAGGEGLEGMAFCVGSIVLKPLKRATAEDYVEAFRLNALGPALAVQAGERLLRQARGSVVLFSTVAAGSGFSNHSVVAAAKGAVEALTRSLAAELAPDVRVNCIAPSLLRTPLAQPLLSSEAVAQSIAQMHPLSRLGEAEDAAALAAFLLSEAAGWITGQVLGLDGGRGTLRTKG